MQHRRRNGRGQMGNSFQILRGKKSRWLMKPSVLAPKPVSISTARKSSGQLSLSPLKAESRIYILVLPEPSNLSQSLSLRNNRHREFRRKRLEKKSSFALCRASGRRFCFVLLQPEMGFSKKKQLETESKRWVIAGMPICGSLKPINTRPRDRDRDGGGEVMEAEEPCSTTPTTKESRISDRLACPPAPRKRRPPSKCHLNGVREFFTPPDLETVFKLRTERAN
ncbi:hypothetical protein SAY86_013766 [Trapa natans]|uniref:Uncharacterized protein n=1 Tax=Trapa natans TaxID=22666 RepID=A0AAN7QMX8_TRANT|nr:hypothetical protein SAY86_013766 [Trapa natans]